MSRLLRRIKRQRGTDEAAPEPSTAAGHAASPGPAASDMPGSGSPLAAGEDPSDPRPTALRRGRLRKRLRFLERSRELMLRDLGGLVYEVHRAGSANDREHHRQLVAEKVRRLAALDEELRQGGESLRQARGDMVLREPGIGGLCPRCGEIFGSDAQFCSACGTPVQGTREAAEEVDLASMDDQAEAALPGPADQVHASDSARTQVSGPAELNAASGRHGPTTTAPDAGAAQDEPR